MAELGKELAAATAAACMMAAIKLPHRACLANSKQPAGKAGREDNVGVSEKGGRVAVVKAFASTGLQFDFHVGQ